MNSRKIISYVVYGVVGLFFIAISTFIFWYASGTATLGKEFEVKNGETVKLAWSGFEITPDTFHYQKQSSELTCQEQNPTNLEICDGPIRFKNTYTYTVFGNPITQKQVTEEYNYKIQSTSTDYRTFERFIIRESSQ